MALSGDAKTLPDAIFITGSGCPTPLTGYTNLANYPFYVASGTGTRTYADTLHFSGTGTQTLWPEANAAGGTNAYNEISLSGGGSKRIASTDTVGVNTKITSVSGTEFSIYGGLKTGTGESDLNGDIVLNNTNAAVIVGHGNVVFNGNVTDSVGSINSASGSGPVTIGSSSTLTLVGATSVLNFGANDSLKITGIFDNKGPGTNLNFDCTSNVVYNGTQTPQIVVPTLSTNHYGNLSLLGGAKQGGTYTYGHDIYICTNFALGGGNLDMHTNTGTLFMTDTAGTATYAANEEVDGAFSRTVDGAARSYTYNDKFTILTLGTSASNPTQFKITDRPSTAPNVYDASKDIDRKITLNYTGNSVNFTFGIEAGYLLAEGPGSGAWTAPYTQTGVRFYEGDAQPKIEKVGTGQTYGRQAAAGTSLGFVSLAGIGNTATQNVPNGIGLFASNNDLELRTGPTTFYSIADGRWTNPNTWDEGQIPDTASSAEIRTMVYVGIDGPFAGTGNGSGADNTDVNNTKSELSVYPDGYGAQVITIADGFASASVHPSLVVGNEDNGAGYVFKAKATTNPFVNANTTAATGTIPIGAKSSIASNSIFNGLWITTYVTDNSGYTGLPGVPAFGAQSIQNVGSINNEGIIEVGQ
jgi:hypothetical protein